MKAGLSFILLGRMYHVTTFTGCTSGVVSEADSGEGKLSRSGDVLETFACHRGALWQVIRRTGQANALPKVGDKLCPT